MLRVFEFPEPASERGSTAVRHAEYPATFCLVTRIQRHNARVLQTRQIVWLLHRAVDYLGRHVTPSEGRLAGEVNSAEGSLTQ